jgi:glucokinase
MIDRVVLADIGGTNARFALMEHGRIGTPEHMRVADYPLAGDALGAFLARRAAGHAPRAAIFGVAGPVEDNRCVLTNSPWVVDGNELARTFGFASVHVLNDFEALGWSLPALQPTDLFPVGGQGAATAAPMLVLGPGTGFGAAGFLPQGVRPSVVVTEAGHATLPATSDREARVISALRRRFGHVEVEHVLSGSGIENLYHAIIAVDDVTAPARDAAAISEAAFDGSCAICKRTLDMFCAFLGSVAGNLALTFSARGGVFIAGGIVPRFADRLPATTFREQFESKGRYQAYLSPIPIGVVMTPDTSLIGLKTFFERNVMAAS